MTWFTSLVSMWLVLLGCAAWAKPVSQPKHERTEMKLPVILPEVVISVENNGEFQFKYNNCDGEFWETIVFKNKKGRLVFLTFTTPPTKGAIPSQAALGELNGTHLSSEKLNGTFTLSTSPLESDGVIRKTLRGTLNLGRETFVESSDGACRQVYEDSENVTLQGLT